MLFKAIFYGKEHRKPYSNRCLRKNGWYCLLYIPSFKYEPSFEFDEEDVELIKHIASKEDWESTKTLADWFENAEEE